MSGRILSTVHRPDSGTADGESPGFPLALIRGAGSIVEAVGRIDRGFVRRRRGEFCVLFWAAVVNPVPHAVVGPR